MRLDLFVEKGYFIACAAFKAPPRTVTSRSCYMCAYDISAHQFGTLPIKVWSALLAKLGKKRELSRRRIERERQRLMHRRSKVLHPNTLSSASAAFTRCPGVTMPCRGLMLQPRTLSLVDPGNSPWPLRRGDSSMPRNVQHAFGGAGPTISDRRRIRPPTQQLLADIAR